MLTWAISRVGKDASALEGPSSPSATLMSVISGYLLVKQWFTPPVIILHSWGAFFFAYFLDRLIVYVLTLLFPEIWTLINHRFPSLSSRHFNKFSKWSHRFGYTLWVLSSLPTSWAFVYLVNRKACMEPLQQEGCLQFFSACIYLMRKCEFALGRSLSFRIARALWAGTVMSTVLKSIAWVVLRVAASSVHTVKKLYGLFDRKSTFPK